MENSKFSELCWLELISKELENQKVFGKNLLENLAYRESYKFTKNLRRFFLNKTEETSI